MGTRGLLVVVYKDKYYTVFNQYDSYPSMFGNVIVILLKSVDYALWGEKFEERVSKNYKSDDEDNFGNVIGILFKENSFYHMLTDKIVPFFLKDDTITVETEIPKISMDEPWIYSVDLNTNKFKLTGGIHELEYPIDNIPINWYASLEKKEEE